MGPIICWPDVQFSIHPFFFSIAVSEVKKKKQEAEVQTLAPFRAGVSCLIPAPFSSQPVAQEIYD